MVRPGTRYPADYDELENLHRRTHATEDQLLAPWRGPSPEREPVSPDEQVRRHPREKDHLHHYETGEIQPQKLADHLIWDHGELPDQIDDSLSREDSNPSMRFHHLKWWHYDAHDWAHKEGYSNWPDEGWPG